MRLVKCKRWGIEVTEHLPLKNYYGRGNLDGRVL